MSQNNFPAWQNAKQPYPKVTPPASIPKAHTAIGAKRAELLTGKKYRTRNYMVLTEKEVHPDGVSRAILEMNKEFEAKYASSWSGRHISRPMDLVRYFDWLYLTGSRKKEPFLKPYPKINIFKPKGFPWRIVKVTRVIEKSFANGERTIHEQNIPIFDVTEDKLWRKVLNDYETFELDDLFSSMEKHDIHNGLTGIIERNFHCNMREEATGRLLKDAPITPHALRHHRAYNLYIERGLDKDLVTSLFGWRDDRMLDFYAYINRSAKGQQQLQALKKYAALLSPKKHA